jgi:hypothetical protein
MKNFKKRIALSIISTFTIITMANAQTDSVYLFAGQSNAQGKGLHPVGYSSPYWMDIIKNPPYMFSIGGVSYDLALNNPRVYGPEYTFARVMHVFNNQPIKILKTTWGGTTLAANNVTSSKLDWSASSTGEMYDLLSRDIQNKNILAIFWDQGQTDAMAPCSRNFKDPQTGELMCWADNYLSNIRSFFGSLGSLSNTPLFISRIASENYFQVRPIMMPGWNMVKDAQNTFAAERPNTTIINNDGRETLADGLHYSGESLDKIGIDFAKSLLTPQQATRIVYATSSDISPLTLTQPDIVAVMGSTSDLIYSYGLNSTIVSGDGDDKIYVKSGSLVVDGEWGDDTLVGGSKDDILNGGKGTDKLQGRGGKDIFVFEPGWGSDTVYDFEKGVDKLKVVGKQFSDFTVSQVGTRALLKLNATDMIYFLNTASSTISATDFIQ